MKELQVRNTQRDQRIDTPFLRLIARKLLTDLGIAEYELGIHLVSAAKMEKINEQYLQHHGATDVITFDLSTEATFMKGTGSPAPLSGEIYICIAVAKGQAAEFGTTWPSELVRYLIHGILHLLGYDDLSSAKRRVMKREENRLVKRLEQQFEVNRLAR